MARLARLAGVARPARPATLGIEKEGYADRVDIFSKEKQRCGDRVDHISQEQPRVADKLCRISGEKQGCADRIMHFLKKNRDRLAKNFQENTKGYPDRLGHNSRGKTLLGL